MEKSRVVPTIFFIEKISFSSKLFSGDFYGQSFIKTVRGPLALLKENQSGDPDFFDFFLKCQIIFHEKQKIKIFNCQIF